MTHPFWRSVGPLLALLALAATPAGAAEGCADARSRQFDFWLGDWAVYDATYGEFAGFNNVSTILDGCVLQEQWLGKSGSAGTSLNFFDTRAQRWRQFWVWREGTTLELEGEFRDGRMVLAGASAGPDGKPLQNRITWSANADGSVRQLWEVSADGGSSWRVEFDGLYRKREQPGG